MDYIKKDGTVVFGTSVDIDYSPPKCTVDEGMARYAHAEQVLTAIGERLLKCKPPPMKLPGVKEICRGEDEAKEAARVPEGYRCAFLLENINTIAGTMKSTVTSSDTHRIFNIRYNVVVMTFLWALDETGEGEGNFAWTQYINPSDSRGRARYDFWKAYVEAWLEALKPDGNFTAQCKFLELWQQSEFDLVVFSRANTERMDKVMATLLKRIPKVPYGDPLKFLDLAKSPGGMNLEVRQARPAYALHFIIASGDEAKNFDQKIAQLVAHAEEEKALMEEHELINALMDQEVRLEKFAIAAAKARADNQGMDIDEDDDNFKDVYFSEDDEDDDMVTEELLPMDVSRVKWDEAPVSHLMSV
ncbi:hypothetical protein P171DRAFT_501562 [Karstenula rhodostoma CBS 690.94]|uniref:Uncharacterized protein n=1 Tax=Karstenula rhodostoma CBS 690.94 TaxID=1392251 RepID=A0A9P4PA48_9PLEO|nr:hypothetical protein P171DRAFT_501562 [Karstenula rhodostoma CBS 690.94]